MNRYAIAVSILIQASAVIVAAAPERETRPILTLCCSPQNDLLRALRQSGTALERVSPEDATKAVDAASSGGAVLLLADQYPAKRTSVPSDVVRRAASRGVRLFIEFPEAFEGVQANPQTAKWERLVIASDAFGSALPKLTILSAHQCSYLPAKPDDVLISIARVAGYDRAIFGIPDAAMPALFRTADHKALIATTCLSNFVTGRYAPQQRWCALWESILAQLVPGRTFHLSIDPVVHPAFGKDDRVSDDLEAQTFRRAIRWIDKSRVLLTPERLKQIVPMLATDTENVSLNPDAESGNGSNGVLEGFASAIQPDGTQLLRTPVRADCISEIAMMLALDSKLNRSGKSATTARNLLKYLYSTMQAGKRADPKHPAYGLVAWGAYSHAWERQNYGDDDARVILASMTAACALKSDKWDGNLGRALLANLRTSNRLGFRPDSISMEDLEKNGWRKYHDSTDVNYSPHFESYLWACFLAAYKLTGKTEFLDATTTAIRMTMQVYPDKWRWGDNMERARMLLCLSWLVRISDTPEHLVWLRTVANDLLKSQEACGAIRERLAGAGGGHYKIPDSNESYGTAETPMIQTNDDTASDQLYTTGFALLGLHEAAAATHDPNLRTAEDRLAQYLCRIQIRSEKFPQFDGAWYRAFDFTKWDYWASSADLGWGAWSIEAGWGSAWITATLALRESQISLWDLLQKSTVAREISANRSMLD